MECVFRKSRANRCQGEFTDGKKRYNLIFGLFEEVVSDKNISWETKGYLAGLLLTPNEIEIPDHIEDELIKYGYLVEVTP